MKTALLFIALILFTHCNKTSKPAPVTYKICNSKEFLGIGNYIGWDNNSLQLQSVLHINNNLTPVFITGGSLRVKLPISTGWGLQSLNDNTFIGCTCNSCIPAADTCTIETDSEIKTHLTDTTLYYKPLCLPGC